MKEAKQVNCGWVYIDLPLIVVNTIDENRNLGHTTRTGYIRSLIIEDLKRRGVLDESFPERRPWPALDEYSFVDFVLKEGCAED